MSCTFWKLISEHRIEIPIIQRDYAQGRDSSKSKDIRSAFVKQIKAALSDEKELHLNFVYGKINGIINATKLAENKAAIQSMLNAVQSYSKNLDLNIVCEIKDPENSEEGIHQTSFIPLDGQQRLTTLFLLHWYLMPHSDENKMVMKNFSYRIRPSSKDFCTALVDNTKSVSEQIRDSSWFFSYWEKDPTVRGMLRMIDEIHEQFKNQTEEELQNYWERLTGNNKFISFEFLDLDEYNLTDDLYIKMNARGKPLTPFENFKAWLMDFISDKKIDNKNWTLLVDTEWTDLFWDNKDEAKMLIDEEYMRFFRNMAQIYYVQKGAFKPDGKSDEDKQNREKATLLATTKGEDGEYLFIPNHFFAELDVFTPNNLNEIFLIIDILADKDRGLSKIEASIKDIEFFNGDKKKSLFKAFINGRMTYPDKARFYGMMLYLLKYNKDHLFDEVKFKSWMRVVRNLIENTVTGIVSFTGAIRGLFKLSEHCDNIYGYLAKADSKDISGFDVLQRQEEIRKAELIDKNTDWEKKLLTYEKHKYFKGQINFLIDVSSENGQITTDRFEEYAQKCAAIFSHKLENKNDVIFEQALLTKGDYLVCVGINKSFVQMDKPNQDWRTTVFRDNDKIAMLKELLKKISKGNEIKEMKELIEKHSVSDWRKHFIDHPDTITYCDQRFIRWNSEDDIKLLGSSQINHYHKELYSYSLFLDLKSLLDKNEIDICPFKELKHHSVRSNSEKTYILLDKFVRSENYNYAIKVYYSDSNYTIELFNRENAEIEDDIKKVLKNERFQNQTDNFTISIKDEKETKEFLLKLCKELKN